MQYPNGGYRGSASGPGGPGFRGPTRGGGWSGSPLLGAVSDKTFMGAMRKEFPVLSRPLGERRGPTPGILQREPFRAPLSPKDIKRLATGLRPPWMTIGQELAARYFEYLNEKYRNTPRVYRGMMFPGYQVIARCPGTRADSFDGVHSQDCFEVFGPGVYHIDHAPSSEFNPIQTWEMIAPTAIEGAYWGKACETWMPTKPWPDGVWPGVVRARANELTDPDMIDWAAVDPEAAPEGWTVPRSSTSPWPQPEPRPWYMPDAMFDPNARPWADPEVMPEALPGPWPDPAFDPRHQPRPDPTLDPRDPFTPRVDSPPGRKVGEIKLKFGRPYMAAKKLFNAASEARDAIHAVWSALPPECKKHRPPRAAHQRGKGNTSVGKLAKIGPAQGLSDIMGCPVTYGQDMPNRRVKPGVYKPGMTAEAFWDKAIQNLIEEQAQDYAIGKFGRKGAEASAKSKPHGRMPIGLQAGSGYR